MKLENRIPATTKEIHDLLVSLKPTIKDDYRASDDLEDDTPGMQVTVGADATGWGWQTGDNSFSGGAYGYAFWGVGYLYRDSNCMEIAKEMRAEILDSAAMSED